MKFTFAALFCFPKHRLLTPVLLLCVSLFIPLGLSGQSPCPSPGVLSITPAGICEGESFQTVTVSEVENLALADNGQTTFRLDFFLFSEQTDAPYDESGSTFLGFLQNTFITDGTFSFPAVNFIENINDGGFIYAILNPLPEDASCRPFAELELLVGPPPEVETIFAGTVCADFFSANVNAGLLPLGGVYSGPGVSDNGDGISYTFDAAEAGTDTVTVDYTVTVNGCVGAGGVTIEVLPLPEVSFMLDVDTISIANGPLSGLSGGTPIGGIYSGFGVIDDNNGSTFTYDPAAAGVGTFMVTYTYADLSTANACSASAVDSIAVVAVSSVNDFAANNIRVAPNPTKGEVFITTSNQQEHFITSYRLLDAQGKLVQVGQLAAGQNRLDLVQVNTGVYFLRLFDSRSGQWTTSKLVKQN